MCKCPSCDSSSRRRLERNFILKLVPKAKYYKCYRCKTKFLKVPFILNSFVIKKEIPNNVQVLN